METEPRYSISALAEQAGVTPRTIRYYTAEGLLPQPETHGRYASYHAEHLARLQRIAELKAAYMPLNVIRAHLEAERSAEQHPASRQPQLPATHQATVGQGTQHQPDHAAYLIAPVSPDTAPTPLQLGRYQFFPAIPERLNEASSDIIASRAGFWERIPLADGIELHVSEAISPEQRQRVAELIATARILLSNPNTE